MLYSPTPLALIALGILLAATIALALRLARNANSPHAYFATNGQTPRLINGLALAGAFLSAVSLLCITGTIAFYGYDGFPYAIGFFSGWLLCLYLIAEPIKRMGGGKYNLADTLAPRSNSVRLTVSLSTLTVCVFLLVPQLTIAGKLIGHTTLGPIILGTAAILIVALAGMLATTWLQFAKATALLIVCGILTLAVLNRGLTTDPNFDPAFRKPQRTESLDHNFLTKNNLTLLPAEDQWKRTPYVRFQNNATDEISIWRKQFIDGWTLPAFSTQAAVETQYLVNGIPQGKGGGNFFSVGHIDRLIPPAEQTGPLFPTKFLHTLFQSRITTWQREHDFIDPDGSRTAIFYPINKEGTTMLAPGNSPQLANRLNFISLMLALFCGTASLPHILNRYHTVKDPSAARKSTLIALTAIGIFYILILFLGLAAMTSGILDLTDPTTALLRLAKSFSPLTFAAFSTLAFLAILGTASALLMATATTTAPQIKNARMTAIIAGLAAIILAITCQKTDPLLLTTWSFSIAAAAHLPALLCRLFWKRTTAPAITASILVGLVSSLLWIAFHVHLPFDHPAIITLPLSFLTLIALSWGHAKT
ncbi:MAG: hypothetical protein FWD53_04685 [Phycisphaerales bacterium]|nr:hypothetical protein [Phycisphaerales bacterium]